MIGIQSGSESDRTDHPSSDSANWSARVLFVPKEMRRAGFLSSCTFRMLYIMTTESDSRIPALKWRVLADQDRGCGGPGPPQLWAAQAIAKSTSYREAIATMNSRPVATANPPQMKAATRNPPPARPDTAARTRAVQPNTSGPKMSV